MYKDEKLYSNEKLEKFSFSDLVRTPQLIQGLTPTSFWEAWKNAVKDNQLMEQVCHEFEREHIRRVHEMSRLLNGEKETLVLEGKSKK